MRCVTATPNLGDCMMVNMCFREERVLAGPTPGLTRDATSVPLEHNGRKLVLVDTAGMRRKGNHLI